MSRAVRGLLIALAVVLLLAVVVGVAAMVLFRVFPIGYRMMGPGFMRGMYFPFGGGILGLVIGVLVIVGVIWFVAALVRGSRSPTQVYPPANPPTSLPANESPLDILKRRYARGEITKEQFDAMRHDIE